MSFMVRLHTWTPDNSTEKAISERSTTHSLERRKDSPDLLLSTSILGQEFDESGINFYVGVEPGNEV